MNRVRTILVLTLGGVIVVCIVAAFLQFWRRDGAPRPLSVPPGDQEIAWFQPATSAATWERFVTGAHRAARADPRLQVDDSRAFLDETTAVPEVVVVRSDSTQKLRVRWYKQSSRMTVDNWVKALAQRDPPPLAILGGGSSDRALELARILAAQNGWRGEAPLLLLTTATANTVYLDSNDGDTRCDLMKVYPNRTFRFCFTNRQMAGAVLDFVWRTPDIRPHGLPVPLLGAIGCAAGGDILGCIALAAQREAAPEIFALEWKDDPYSVDLSEQFRDVLYSELDQAPWSRYGRVPLQILPVASSIGGFLRPNAGEARALETLLDPDPPFMLRSLPRSQMQKSLLILPAVAAPARRVLAGLVGADPTIASTMVAVSGDSISFANVYRDADLVWDMRLVPVPLVLFTHQNPVAWDAHDERSKNGRDPFGLYPPNGTDDVLHFADVVRLLAAAGWDSASSGIRSLQGSSVELANQLRCSDPPFFDADGNRLGGSGESVVYLRPRNATSGRDRAELEVWSHRDLSGWQFVKRLTQPNR
jgi:hypothetical protein